MQLTNTSSCLAIGFFFTGFGDAAGSDAELLNSSSVSLLSSCRAVSNPSSSSISEGSDRDLERSNFSWHLLHSLI